MRWLRGGWFSHDLTGGLNGNLSNTRRPSAINTVRTSDYSGTLRGALLLYQAAPVGLNVNYSVRKTRVETPADSDLVNRLLTSNASADATMRFRVDNDRYLNLTGGAGQNNTLQGTRGDQTFRAETRWQLGAWQLDGTASDQISTSEFFQNGTAGGYVVDEDNRQAGATLQRQFTQRLAGKLITSILLDQTRSAAKVASASPPTPRDTYRQSYRIEGLYNYSEKLNSGVALDVSLARQINLPAVSTSNNTDTRSYRAEWRWSYRMLRGLTASQSNTVQADYEFYPFAEERNNVSLDYNSVTNLAAVLTPRLTIDLTHNARQQPRGDWRVLPRRLRRAAAVGPELNYTLRSRVTWSPSPDISFSLTPEYIATDRTGTNNGNEVPTRSSRRLNLAGNANLRIPLGKKGELTGSIGRNFSS